MAPLRDLDQQPFDTAPADDLPVTAPTGRWVVLTDDAGQPVGAVAPGTTLAAAQRPASILVAEGGLDQGAAYDSAAFRDFFDASALVLTELVPPEADEGTAAHALPEVTGVVGGEALTRLMQRGPVRGIFDPGLPGTPAIPLISRSCDYLQGIATCATVMKFASRPFRPPLCLNEHGLPAHDFVW